MPYGYAPYEEAAAKGTARVSLMQRLGQIFAGAGQGIAASQNAQNPFEAGALGFAGGFGQANAARQAAEAYAMKKIEAQQAQEMRDYQKQNILSEIKAREKPPAPPKPDRQFGPRPWYEDPALANDPNAIAARQKATHISPPKPAKVEKPPKLRPAVQNMLDAIQTADPNNPAHRARLEGVIANPLTPEIGEAARARLRIGGKEFYRFQPVGPDSSQTGGLRYR